MALNLRIPAAALILAATLTLNAEPLACDVKGRELMIKSLKCQFGVNIVAILSQLDASGTCYDTVKVERSADGKIRQTFLAPLCMQGVSSVDDGQHSFIYWPDEKRLMKQDSQRRDDCINNRIPLALRNYTFTFEGHCEVAGRKANCVLATPKASDLEIRHYYLEPTTAYPLKLETISPNGDVVVKYEIKDIQFPPALDPRVFSIRTVGNLETLDRHKPSDVDPKRAAAVMGFEPILPHGLPMGFQVQEVQEDVSKDWHALIIRLTDGLIRATIYEWKSKGANDSKVKLYEKYTQVEYKGVCLVILADLSQELRDRLLAAFISDAENGTPDPDWYYGGWR